MMPLQRYLYNLPVKSRVAIADRTFLTEDSAAAALERDELRGKRQKALHAVAGVSLAALPTILGATVWQSDERLGTTSLALASVFFGIACAFAAAGAFLAWFEPRLRRAAPSKRFIIGPDDNGDYEDQATQHLELEWVEDNAHLEIPRAIRWRVVEACIWTCLIVGAFLFTTGLLVGGVGVLVALLRP